MSLPGILGLHRAGDMGTDVMFATPAATSAFSLFLAVLPETVFPGALAGIAVVAGVAAVLFACVVPTAAAAHVYVVGDPGRASSVRAARCLAFVGLAGVGEAFDRLSFDLAGSCPPCAGPEAVAVDAARISWTCAPVTPASAGPEDYVSAFGLLHLSFRPVFP